MRTKLTSEFLPLLRNTTLVLGRKQGKPFYKSLYLIVYLLAVQFLITNQLVFAQSDGIKKTIEKYQKIFFVWNEPEKENSNSDSILTVLGRWAWGPCNAVDAKGDYAYIGNGPTFQVLEISDPNKPEVYGEYLTEGYIYDLEVNGNLAFVCLGSGLLILDISEPSSPEYLSFVEINGIAISFALTDSFAYVSTISGHMRVVDIADPSNPFLRGSIDEVGNFSTSIEAKDGYVYIGNIQYPYLLIVNATDPDNLTKTAFNIEGKATCSFIQDSLLFLGVSWATTKLKVYSISNLTQPNFLGQVEIADSILMDAVTVSDDGLTAFSLCLTSVSKYFGKGIYSIDISDVTEPVIMDKFIRPSQQGTPSIASSAKKLFAAYFSGVVILDVTVPSSIQFHSFFPTGGFSNRLQVKDSLAFVASGLSGLWILDISVPEKPKEISNVNTGGFTSDIVVDDSIAYIVNWAAYEDDDSTRGLWIIDFADIENPYTISHHIGIIRPDNTGVPNSINKSDNLVMITEAAAANSYNVLEIVDVSNPYQPISIGIFQGNFRAFNTAIKDQIVYLATSNGGLRLIDINDPYNPIEIGVFSDNSSLIGIFIENNLAFADRIDTLFVLNVSSPSKPLILGKMGRNSGSFGGIDLYAEENFLYWAEWILGVVNIKNPENPYQVTTFWGKDRGRGVTALNEKIYYSDQTMGLWILKNNLITSVGNNSHYTMPKGIELYQNYPNPFNPVTSIEFFIPEKVKVQIEIFDVLGRKMQNLLFEEKERGKHKIEFNASMLTSGVYFYRIIAGRYSVVKKMIIVR